MSAQFMLPEDLQTTNELSYAKQHIDKRIRRAIEENPDTLAKVKYGAQLLTDWSSRTYHYERKNRLLAQVQGMDWEKITLDIFVQIAHCRQPETFVSVTSQLAGYLGFDDKEDSLTIIAGIVAVLCYTDAFNIIKADRDSSLMVQSCIPFPQELEQAIYRCQYILPMVSEPKDITSNFESPYLTFNESQILGKGNSHDGDICLDVINTQNKIPLSLSLEFLKTVEEQPTKPHESLEQFQQWETFKADSYGTYLLLAKQGNKFYLTNKVDKRGRLYAQGYHVSTQASPFKKAAVELHNKETIEVPDEYRL